MPDAVRTSYWIAKGENALNNTAQSGNVENMAERNQQILEMPNVRVFYQKKGRAKYISHLDITRCMQRALKRSDIPVWYTQGFNPHMYLTFALPLALGYESECECMDFRLAEPMELEEVQRRLGENLPRDMVVTRVALQKEKPQQIRWADYELRFVCENSDQMSVLFDDFCARPELIVMKRTKKGEKPVDLKPEFSVLGKEIEDGAVVYKMRFTAGQKNINPTLLTDLFLKEYKQDVLVQVLRKQIYLEDGTPFS